MKEDALNPEWSETGHYHRMDFVDLGQQDCVLEEDLDGDHVHFGVLIDCHGRHVKDGLMLLNRDMAKELAPMLKHFAKTGSIK